MASSSTTRQGEGGHLPKFPILDPPLRVHHLTDIVVKVNVALKAHNDTE